MTRIIKEMRETTDGKYPKYIIWGNVPGAFSSNNGRDFHAVLQAFAEIADPNVYVPEPPHKGKTDRLAWRYAGSIVGDGWSVAWRTVDAQYWGVPQRRRRIYLVADFASECAGEILFERKGMPGNTEPSRTQGQETAADAGRSTDGSSCPVTLNRKQLGLDVGMVGEPSCVYALQANGIDRADTAGCNGAGWRENECYTLNTIDRYAVCYTADCRNGVLNEELSGTLQAKPNGSYSLNFINPVVYESNGFGKYSEGFGALRASGGDCGPGSENLCVYDCRGNGDGAVSTCLTGDHQNRVTDYTALIVYPNVTGPLMANSHPGSYTGQDAFSDMLPVVPSNKPHRKYIVRRLTPLECCRLQGFPDWWEDGVEGRP